LGTFDNHFSTIGLVGMNEAGLNAKWLRKDLSAPEAQQFAKDVLNHMRERLSDYQVLYGDLYNLEATPAESTAYRFAKHDKKLYPDIITANENGTPYYTNSSHLPVGYTDDIFEALDIQDELQTLYTSGTVFHAFLGEKLPDWKSAANLVRKIAENYKLPYYTLSPTYSICKNHGYLAGEVKSCPVCGEGTEIYSRITGYYRPVQNWNDGKVQEFEDRRTYNVNKTNKELILVTTSTCPNCKQAEKILKEANIAFKKILAEDNVELVKRLSIMQAPTLVKGDKKYSGLSEIYKFIS
jgi:ribonucleoside-triphosphate reductase